MECGKLTAKLRDAVPVCFIENGREIKRFKNIEIPEEIKHLEFSDFRFDVPETGAITFKIFFDAGILPETWPEKRERQHRAAKEEPEAVIPKAAPATMELRIGATGPDRKTLVAVISTITGIDSRYLGMPSQEYQIGDYLVDREGTLTGPANTDLIAALAAKGYEAK